MNLILAGPLVSKPGSFDWTGQKAFSTKLSDDEVITLCMAFLRLTHEAVLKHKKQSTIISKSTKRKSYF